VSQITPGGSFAAMTFTPRQLLVYGLALFVFLHFADKIFFSSSSSLPNRSPAGKIHCEVRVVCDPFQKEARLVKIKDGGAVILLSFHTPEDAASAAKVILDVLRDYPLPLPPPLPRPSP